MSRSASRHLPRLCFWSEGREPLRKSSYGPEGQQAERWPDGRPNTRNAPGRGRDASDHPLGAVVGVVASGERRARVGAIFLDRRGPPRSVPRGVSGAVHVLAVTRCRERVQGALQAVFDSHVLNPCLWNDETNTEINGQTQHSPDINSIK